MADTEDNFYREPSKNNYILTSTLFYVLGFVTIVPTNFFANAEDYWMYKFRDVNSNRSYDSGNKTELQEEFIKDYTIVSNVSYIALILLTVRRLKEIRLPYRIIGSLCFIIVTFALTCIFVRDITDSWQKGYLIFTLVMGALLRGSSGIFIVTLFQSATKFPSSFVVTIFAGQSLCGTLAGLVKIFALELDGGPEDTGLVYFLSGMILVLLSLLFFSLSWKKNDFLRYHLSKEVRNNRPRPKMEFDKDAFLSGLNKAKYYLISQLIVVICGMMLHPGVITSVVSVDKGNGNKWNDMFYVPVVNFLLYNLLDYIGREAGTVLKKPTNGIIVLILSCLRIPLVPMILLCNAQPRSHLSVVFDVDSIYIILLVVFAFTNGYLVSLNMISVPQVTRGKETAFAMLGVLLLMILSLTLSSTLSNALLKAL